MIIPGSTFGGGPIVGVGLPSPKESIKIFKKQTHYNQWEFVYDPSQDLGGANGFRTRRRHTLQQNGTANNINGSTPGAGDNNGSNSGFGSGTGFGSGSGFGSEFRVRQRNNVELCSNGSGFRQLPVSGTPGKSICAAAVIPGLKALSLFL